MPPPSSIKSPIQLNESEYNPESFYELIVYSEWRQDPISWNNLLKRTCGHIEKPQIKRNWFGFIQNSLWPEKELLSYWSLLLPWLISVSPSGQYVALLQDGLLEIRCSRDDYTTIVGRAAVNKDRIPQCRRMVWSPNSLLVAISSSEGIVSVYDFLAGHLFTIPEPPQKSGSNKRYVVGLELINSPIKLLDWNLSLIVVYSDGMLHFYHISADGCYKEGPTVHLSISGISSATFCQKYQVLFISSKPNNVPVMFKDSSVRAGISGWEMIPKAPYFKQTFPTEEETKVINRVNYLWRIKNYMNSMSCVAKMVVSPKSNWIASYHCCGGIRVWHNPSLRLHRRWDKNDRKNLCASDDETTNKGRLPIAVDIEWLSDEALVVTWDNGTISVHNVHNFGVTYGSDPKFVHGRLRVSSSLAFKGFLALECELVFISMFGEENILEDENEKAAEWLDATSEFIQAVLYLITDNMDYYKPVRRPNQLTRRIYRLLGIKSVTPEERYLRYLEEDEYDKALSLAKKFNLDVDKVYQKQWKANPVSSLTISEYLVNIRDETWILQECISRVPETLSNVHLLLEFGLNRTDFKDIFSVENIEVEDKENIVVDSLTESQKLKLKTRLQIFSFLEKLKIYEIILYKQNLKYNMKFYEKIRNKHIVEIAIIYAQEGNSSAVDIILKERTSLVYPYLLTILSNFPETLDPNIYSFVLPQCNAEGELIPLTQESKNQPDWVECDKFRFLIEKEKISFKFKGSLLMSSEYVSEWYRVRAVEIEWLSGIVQNSVKLLCIGKSYYVMNLDDLLSDFLTLEVLILQLQFNVDFLTFKQWSLLDKGSKLLEKSTEETFNEDIQKYFIPFLNRCRFPSDKERFELFVNVMIRKSTTEFKQSLQFFEFILNSPENISLIGNVDEFVSMVDACYYSYEKLDLIKESLNVIMDVISLLKSFPNQSERETTLSSMYMIRDELSACDVLKQYKINKPIKDIHNIKDSEKEFTEIISSMTKSVIKVVLKLPSLSTTKLEQLLSDILYLQEICFKSFPLKRCYELYASAMLGAESMDLIEFSTNFICCRKEEEISKNVSYDKSIQLILNAARNYFNFSRTHLDDPMYLAKACLHIVKDGNIEVMKELDLIQALRLLSEFGVNVLPLQIRNCEERMKLIECVLNKHKTAYKNFETLFKLSCKLSICPDDSSKRYSLINVRLAEESFKVGDYSYCAHLCENLINYICPDGWDICLKLSSCTEFKDVQIKLKLLEFAFIYAPSKAIYAINEKRKSLEKEVLFNKLCSHTLTTEIVTKLMNGFEVGSENFQLDFSLSLDSNENIDRSVRRSDKQVNSSNATLITLQLSEYILKSLYINTTNIDGNSLLLLDNTLIECGKLTIFEDNAVGISIVTSVTNRNKLEELFSTLPPYSFTYQLAMYYYAILKCFAKNKEFIYDSPTKIVEWALKTDQDYFYKMIMKYKIKNDNYLQAKTATELNCGIDTHRFITDNDYRRDTISGLAMSIELDNALIAIQLALQNGISAKEMAILHLESFLREPSSVPLEYLQKSIEHPTISNIIKQDPELLKNRLFLLLDHLNGCDYLKVSMYFTLFNEIDSTSDIFSLTPKQHLKLMKKVKATSQAINYLDLISHKYNILEVLQPALVAHNFSSVIKLVKNLPESVRGNFSVNVLYRKKAVDEFLITVDEISSLKQCIKQVDSIFNKWLNKVEVSDVKLFMKETVWNRKIAVSLDYEYRRQLILALVSWICSKDDYRENVKYLTNLIQERLDIMDKVWNVNEEDLPISNHLKNYLFDLEEVGNNEAKALEIIKKLGHDPKINKDELFVAYKASGLDSGLTELFQIFIQDEASEKTRTPSQLLSDMESSEERLLSDELKSTEHSNENENFSFEKLLSECKTTAQIKILYSMLDELRSSEPSSDIRSFQIRLLHKLVAVKGSDRFTLVAKLMDEACLEKKEILELVSNNKLTGDILTLVWICIQGNTLELEKLATDFVNDLSEQEIQNLCDRIKTLPWDVIKLLTSSKCYKKFIENIITNEENYLVAYDLVKVLKEIQLLPEASTLEMHMNNVPASLQSFNTAFSSFHYQ